MNHPPNNDPQRRNNGQAPYPFNPSQQGPRQPPVPSQGPYPPFYQGAYPPPAQPPMPGQFYLSPPQPPGKTSSPYKKKILFMLIGTYITFWLFAFVAGAYSPNGFAIFLGNLGVSLFWGMLVSVLIMDWRGFFTIHGWIPWQKGKRAKYISEVSSHGYIMFTQPFLLENGIEIFIAPFSFKPDILEKMPFASYPETLK